MATSRFRLLGAACWTLGLMLIAGLPLALAADQGQSTDLKVPAAVDKAMPESIGELKAIEAHVEMIVKKVMPAVVNVKMPGSGQGSGVVISEDGMVLTAGHVSGAPGKEHTLTFPTGKQVKAKSLGQNKTADTGLFKIIDEGKYPFVEMAKSSELKKGQWCIAIGHPGGLKQGRQPPVRLGRISAPSGAFITTDCTLVGGDSGGPLFDMYGKVIGIHSRIGNPITANMHVPVDTYRDEWERLVKGEAWGNAPGGGGKGGKGGPSARLGGLEFDSEAKDLKIAKVEAGSAADKAGLKANDIIVSVNGKKVGNQQDWRAEIGRGTGGGEVTIEIRRGEATLILKGVLDKVGA